MIDLWTRQIELARREGLAARLTEAEAEALSAPVAGSREAADPRFKEARRLFLRKAERQRDDQLRMFQVRAHGTCSVS